MDSDGLDRAVWKAEAPGGDDLKGLPCLAR